jgi:hypothetical protein
MAWMTARAYLNYANGFDEVHAYAAGGGYDLAWLFDSRGDDRLQSQAGEVWLAGAGFVHAATGFDVVRAASITGGHDRAEFFRTAEEEFSLSNNEAVQHGPGHLHIALGFEQIDQRDGLRALRAVFQELGTGD